MVLDHYLEVLRFKPGALAGSSALAQARAAGVMYQPGSLFGSLSSDRLGYALTHVFREALREPESRHRDSFAPPCWPAPRCPAGRFTFGVTLMLSTTGAESYRSLFRSRIVARTFALAMLGRFGYAVLSLILLFTIAQSSGSFATAATASAVFGLTGLVMPVQARLIDRFTQRRVLPVVGVIFVAALSAMAIVGAMGVSSLTTWSMLCLLAGVSGPSLGPSMRAQWRIFETGQRRTTAYSLDAVTEEVAFLTGPILASVILATGPAWRGLIPVATLVALGVVGLVISPAAATHESHTAPTTTGRDLWGPLRRPKFLALSATMLLAGAGAAAALTGTAAQADAAGHPEWAGLIEAAAGVAAVIGGIAWGRWRLRGTWTAHLTGMLLVRALFMAIAVVAVGIAGTATAMTLSGLLMAPMFVVAYTAADQLTPTHQHTEASTWVTATHNVGTSAGTAAAGWAVANVSATAPFVASAVFLVLAATPLIVGRKDQDPARPSDGDLRGVT